MKLFPLTKVLLILFLLLAPCLTVSAQTVRIAEINGNIDAGTYSYISRVIDEAAKGDTELIIIKINSDSGLIKPTKRIIGKITGSETKIATYSSEKFGGALSASSYILLSSKITAVAPKSFIGYSRPVPADNRSVESMADYMTSLSERGNRNTSFTRELVISNNRVSGEEALNNGIIDYAPENVAELVKTIYPDKVSIAYDGPSMFDQIISLLSNPQVVAFFLLLGSLAGVYAVFTRHIPAGLITLASYIIVVWAAQDMQLSLSGIGLIIFGIALTSLETAHSRPTIFGMTGGLAALMGSITITSEPFYHVGTETYLISFLLTFAVIIPSIILANRLGRSRTERMHSEAEGLIGKKGRVIEDLRRNGLVKIDGKVWPAYSIVEEKILVDSVVEVVKKEGRLLSVVREGGSKTLHGGHGGHDQHAGDDSHVDAHAETRTQGHGTSTHSDVLKKDRMSHAKSEHDDGSHHTTGGPDKNSHEHDHH